MATNTLKTDLYLRAGDPVAILSTDQWDFTYGSNPSNVLECDMWYFEYSQDIHARPIFFQ